MSDHANTIRNIIIEHLGLRPEQVVPSARFFDEFGADELDMAELQLSLQEEFGVEVSNDDLARMTTVQSMIDFIVRRCA